MRGGRSPVAVHSNWTVTLRCDLCGEESRRLWLVPGARDLMTGRRYMACRGCLARYLRDGA